VTNDDYARTLDELDRLLNDPDVPMQPALIWRLADEVLKHDLQAGIVTTAAAAARSSSNQ
jgi:hypothetical protein